MLFVFFIALHCKFNLNICPSNYALAHSSTYSAGQLLHWRWCRFFHNNIRFCSLDFKILHIFNLSIWKHTTQVEEIRNPVRYREWLSIDSTVENLPRQTALSTFTPTKWFLSQHISCTEIHRTPVDWCVRSVQTMSSLKHWIFYTSYNFFPFAK